MTNKEQREVSDLKNAIKVLVRELKNDPDYRRSWQANIAMAFQDFYREDETVHECANKAADYFLNNLCRDPDD